MKCILVNILNNCFPLRLIAPNIDKFLREPVIVTTGLVDPYSPYKGIKEEE
ncbi:MAG: hypothetical protein ACRD4W_06495 [Nitrososphaeraceae archaeon]